MIGSRKLVMERQLNFLVPIQPWIYFIFGDTRDTNTRDQAYPKLVTTEKNNEVRISAYHKRLMKELVRVE
jgi:hypothetical protein